MNTDKSLEIIRALANGVDPHTGEEYPADSPYQHPQTIRALFMATQALERKKKADDRQRQLPSNAGKAWADEEDHRLISLGSIPRCLQRKLSAGQQLLLWGLIPRSLLRGDSFTAFDSGKTTKQLAEEHQRTEGSIRSRLIKHGKIQF